MKKFFTLFAIIFIFQFDLSAQSTFQKTIAVAGYPEFISTGVHRCNDGGFLLSGYDASSTTVGFIIKLDAASQVVWTKLISDSAQVQVMVYSVGECSTGGYYALGYTKDMNYIPNVFLMKMDVAGNMLWDKLFQMPVGESIYGSVPPKVTELPSGEFLICTAMYSSVGIIKTDATGNVIFAKSIIGDSLEPKNPGLDAIVSNDGGILAAGKRGNDPYFVKTDASGNIQWTKIFTMSNFYNRIYRMVATSDGGYIAAGMKADATTYTYSGFLMKLNANGNVDWYKEYSNNIVGFFYFTDIKELYNGSFLVIAANASNDQRVLIQTDINGTLQSSRIIGVPAMENTYTYTGFDMSAAGLQLVYSTYSLSFERTTYFFNTTDLNLYWCDVTPYPLTETTVNYTPVVTAGALVRPIVLSTASFSSVQTTTISLTDYCLTSNVNEVAAPNTSSVFPNPVSTSGTITADQSAIDNGAVFILFDMLGNEIKRTTLTNKQTEFAREAIPAGCYLYTISTEKGMIANGKIILAD